MGERELVLDGMSVEDVMRIVGAASSAPARSANAGDSRAQGAVTNVEPPSANSPPAADTSTDWRFSSRWRTSPTT